MLELREALLYYLCEAAGAFMIVGGIVLIYKQKIFIDRESKQITEIETPLGKFRTNIPALFLFVLGFIPLIFPIWELHQHRPSEKVVGEFTVTGKTGAALPITVYAVADHQDLNHPGQYELTVPPLQDGHPYAVLYSYCGGLRMGQGTTRRDGGFTIADSEDLSTFVCPNKLTAR